LKRIRSRRIFLRFKEVIMISTMIRRAARSLAALVLIASLATITSCASLRGDADADARAEKPAAAALVATASGVTLNMPKPGLYTAGQPAAGDWAALADAGVRTVVNLRTAKEMQGRDERSEVAAAGMRYIEIPVDGAGGISSENARRLNEALASARGDVLVHCATSNRAGGLLAVALAQQGMGADDALAIGRAAGMKSTEARVLELLGESERAVCDAGAANGADVALGCPATP
jgi:uncharacterized protein (TIGR01244 family)